MDDPAHDEGRFGPGHTHDPGWGRVVLVAVVVIVPGAAWLTRRMGVDLGADALVTLRLVVLTFGVSLVLMGFVLAGVLTGTEPSDNAPLLTLAVVGVGLAGLVSSQLADRGVDGTDATTLVTTYRTNLFLRIALAESPAVVGFVLAFIAFSLWPYLAGAAFALVGLWRAAPTAANLDRAQRRLYEQGSTLSLRDTLRSVTAGPS